MKSNRVSHTIAPIYDKDSSVIILGSFPSVISRQEGFYYANPTNRFWKVLSKVFQDSVDQPKQFCIKHHIALWDVVASCNIDGSKDTSIQKVSYNNIQKIVDASSIQAICTTGKKAYALYQKHPSSNLPVYSLPSTSAANAACSFEELVKEYQILRRLTHETC